MDVEPEIVKQIDKYIRDFINIKKYTLNDVTSKTIIKYDK